MSLKQAALPQPGPRWLPWAIPTTCHSRLLLSKDGASVASIPRLSIWCQIPARGIENCQPGGTPEAGLHNALPAASLYKKETNRQPGINTTPTPHPPPGSNRRAENSFFTTGDDSRVAQLGPASGEAGGGKWGWGERRKPQEEPVQKRSEVCE